MRIVAISAAIVTMTAATCLIAQQPQPQPQPAQVQPLSPTAMEALVASIAFYPDAVIEQILDAAQYPDAIKRAATGTAGSAEELTWPSSVRLLTTHREVLRQLDQNAVITARLALAARTQLADVWAAIDRVRQQFESQSQNVAPDTATGGTTITSSLVYPTGAFLAGFWTAQVVDEVGVWYAATAPVAVVYAQGSATQSANVQHSGSGTYTGQGTGSYDGSTDIESTRGDVSMDTAASGGQITSTITTPQGQQTITLGDGQTGASSGATTTTRMARPSSVPAMDSIYSHPSLEQWQVGRRTLADSWGQLSHGNSSFQGTNLLWGNPAVNPSVLKPQFARPNTLAPGALDALRANTIQPPTRNFNAPGNRAPTGGRRGRR